MNPFWIKSLTLVGALALHSHAIFGIGAHWSPAVGLELESDSGAIHPAANIRLNEKGASGLQGFGVKMWIDALPLVDIQMTGNVQFATYGLDLIMDRTGGGAGDTTIPLEFNLGPLFPKAKPPFGRIFGDLAILYPFLKIPPVVSLMKFYGGAGVTYGMATEVMSRDFGTKVLNAYITANPSFDPTTATPAQMGTLLADGIEKAGLISGMGGFIQVGTQVKPPIIPLAAYLDFKYHFLGFNPSLVGGTALTMEFGAALAF